jgi:DNA-binding LytR/AlgR family response regulator
MGKILIVEDEVLIASAIKRNLIQNGYECAGIAIDADQTLDILKTTEIDLLLIDVNISGDLNGIELAKLINRDYNLPFMFITSYRDESTISEILKTNPEAYLSKPIDQLSLLTNLKIFFQKYESESFIFQSGSTTHKIDLEELRYIRVDHVYLELYYEEQKEVIRASLNYLLEQLPTDNIIRINRSLAVNQKFITKIARRKLYMGELQFPISPLYLENLETLSL